MAWQRRVRPAVVTGFLPLLLLCVSAHAEESQGCVSGVSDVHGLKKTMDAIAHALLEYDDRRPRECPVGKKGIATSMGTQQQIDNAYATISILRSTWKSPLPVTIFHWGDEVSVGVMNHFSEQFGKNVGFVDMQNLTTALPHKCDSGTKPAGFVLKALGVYHAASLYEHLLWMDSDNFLLADPLTLFDSKEYEEHGSLFWPDFFTGWVKPEIYKVLTSNKHTPSSGLTADTESGQILLNTCKHQDVLEFVLALNEHDSVTYNYMFGDKDTFRLGFALAGKMLSFYQIPHYPGSTFTTMADKELQRLHSESLKLDTDSSKTAAIAEIAKRCTGSDPAFMVAMIQKGPNGNPQFLHRTNAEFSLNEAQQIQSTFLLPALSPKAIQKKLWQVEWPGQGWAICTGENSNLLKTTGDTEVERIEKHASASLQELRTQLSLNKALSTEYEKVVPGSPNEIVRAMQMRRGGIAPSVNGTNNSTNSSNGTMPLTWTPKFDAVTQLTQSISAGVTTLPIQSSAKFAVGRTLMINRGGLTQEFVVVAGFGSILLQAPTQYPHAANEAIEQIIQPLKFCPDGGSHFGRVQNLTLSTSITGASIYYTTDGSEATASSTLYTPGSEIEITSDTDICAIAINSDDETSSSCNKFMVTAGTLSTQAPAPVFSQPGGIVRVGDKVQISTPGTSDTSLYWTASENFTAPTACSWESPAKGVLVIDFSTVTRAEFTISAFAAKAGLLHSEIRSATFEVRPAEEDFSVGVGASRVKFKEQEV